MNEIETILCKIFRCDRSRLYLDKSASVLKQAELGRLEGILKKRLRGEPLQYLVGDVDFMGLRLRVKPGVLIPRPETEILVEEALRRIAATGRAGCRVLDLGTGSGNIAIACASSLKDAGIFAVDISEECLSVARANAGLNAVAGRITFLKSDIFSAFAGKDIRFDFIVSNPPYIAQDDYDLLPEDVRREPAVALKAGADGLLFYAEIEKGSREYLKQAGALFLEIGEGQAPGIKKIFRDASLWKEVQFINDHNGIERVAVVERKQGRET